MTWQETYLSTFYATDRGFVDGTTEFHNLCASVCRKGARILEIGAGPSNATSTFLASLGELHGMDPDVSVKQNSALRSATVLVGDRFPLDDESFDVCVSNFVCEHVLEPAVHLAEVRRVLVPGGAYVFRTPNRFHYVAGVSALTPHWFHELVANRLRNLESGAHDPYPTHYRMNSQGRVRQLAREAGLRVESLRAVEKEPSYGMSSRLLFLTFMAYERLVNSTELLAGFRSSLFAVLRNDS
jgi:SAM-dependent methyltransferase